MSPETEKEESNELGDIYIYMYIQDTGNKAAGWRCEECRKCTHHPAQTA
jgi:hypothetical protein